jgi:uncharacterized protein (DUF2141 family)
VILELDNADAQWDNKVAPFATGNINAQAGSVVYVFRDLKAGKYSVGVFHDENGNGNFDLDVLGIPKESWGFSNNPRGLRKASFDEARFSIGSENLAITIHLMRIMTTHRASPLARILWKIQRADASSVAVRTD